MQRAGLTAALVVLASSIAVSSSAQDSIDGATLLTSPIRQYEKAEWNVAVKATWTDPYLATDIALDMVIAAPSGKSLVLPCYYESGESGTTSQWKARFAPPEAGSYAYSFRISRNGVTTAVSAPGSFAAQPTAKSGVLHSRDFWTFRFDNGQLFRGIGENVGWESRSWEDSKYDYSYLLGGLADSGATFFRTWMSPWNLPLEWKQVVDTNRYSASPAHFNPGAIARLDELTVLCDARGLHMMLVLDYHGALGSNWNLSNYNAANGGPLDAPREFFTNAAAKDLYKSRLRYLVARWGYSPSIGAWEFWNEVDNAMYSSDNGGFEQIPDAEVTAWHDEMSTYLKGIDPYGHLVTTSISWRDVAGLNDLTNIDFNQKHIYRYTGDIPGNILAYEANHAKPYVIGEFAWDWDWNNVTAANGPSFDYDFKRGLWYGLFTPTPVLPMSWWWEFFDSRGMIPYLRSVREISDRMLAAGGGSFSPVSGAASGLQVFAVKTGPVYFTYLLNDNVIAADTSLSLPVAEGVPFTVRSFNPADRSDTQLGEFAPSGGALTVPIALGGHDERVFIAIPEGVTVGEQLPYGGVPRTIPGTVQAEDFDLGGEGIAYHDLEPQNLLGQYRDEGVDIEANGPGYDVSAIVAGEWTEYTVEVSEAATYSLGVQVAAATEGRAFHVELDGQDISGPIAVPNTGGSQAWQTVSVATPLLTAGRKVLRVVFDTSDFSLDSLQFDLLSRAPTVRLTAPASGSQFELPAVVPLQAEAVDPDGSIAKVEFYDGGSKLGEDTTAPYELSWSNPGVGSHGLYARATDDSGIIAQSAIVTINVIPSQVQTPFVGAPLPIPGTVEAENYDDGAESVAYHDTTPGNAFGAYRSDGVDIGWNSDTSNYSVGGIQPGEWIEYTVDVAADGSYDVFARVATPLDGMSFHLEMDGVDVSGPIAVPNTGDWSAWQTTVKPGVALTAGTKVMRVVFDVPWFNFNYLAFTPSGGAQPPRVTLTSPGNWTAFEAGAALTLAANATADGTIARVEFFDSTVKLGEALTPPYQMSWTATAGWHRLYARAVDDQGLPSISNVAQVQVQQQAPYLGTPFAVPGKIEAEDYDTGGEGIAYHDLGPTNSKGQYRNDGVDIESCTDEGGGFNLADIQPGEWVEYTLAVARSGDYRFLSRVATQMDGQQFRIEIDGVDVTGTISVPNTGGWQTWQTLESATVHLDAGTRIMRVAFGSQYFNLNFVAVEKVFVPPAVSVDDVSMPEGNHGTRDAVFTVRLSEPSDRDATVDYATHDGTASSASGPHQDYVAVSGSLTIPAGVLTGTIAVPILGDRKREPDETFFLDLSNPVDAVLSDSQGRATILNDDHPARVQFRAASFSVREDAGVARIEVIRVPDDMGASTVDYATADGTATQPADYQSTSGTLEFAPGQRVASFEVPIVDDTLHERVETVVLRLSSPTGAVLGPLATAVLRIRDDDCTGRPRRPHGTSSLARGR